MAQTVQIGDQEVEVSDGAAAICARLDRLIALLERPQVVAHVNVAYNGNDYGTADAITAHLRRLLQLNGD